MDPAGVSAIAEDLVILWHNHRLSILLVVGLAIAWLRLEFYRRGNRQRASPSVSLDSISQGKSLVAESKQTILEKDHYTTDFAIFSSPKLSTKQPPPKRVTGIKRPRTTSNHPKENSDPKSIQPHIFFFSLGGTTKSHAEVLHTSLSSSSINLPPILHDLTEIDYDDFFISTPQSDSNNTSQFYILLIPSYDISTELDNFLDHLKETHHDFRIDSAPLAGLAGYTVLGFGDKEGWASEEEGFGKDAIAVDKWMARLTGGRRAWPVGVGDVKADYDQMLEDWRKGIVGVMGDLAEGKGLGEGVAGAGEAVESGDEDDAVEGMEDIASRPRKKTSSRSPDLEDMKGPIPVDFTTSPSGPIKPMVPKTSPTYTSLTKQGYTIVGTHSGVKTCRWTKSALRGRGSCYKYSFYGIASHLCMEATPSLSCSNKCVFCWRHGTNPVSTTWRWSVDHPNMVFDGMKDGHYRKIKALKGVPGVRAERFQEAMKIRHCALSLVGEPIFYPRINELLALLHKERISTFLVCNAQHPDHLRRLNQVTQLYVSIDASNAESLKRIDRPLHRDYWERFLACMDILREKRFTQRTVFRLTLVKGFNIDEEISGYADLVQRALPAFIEIKGVTYCGTSTSKGAGLSMSNVPFWEEVAAFVEALSSTLHQRGLEYDIAAEHRHSCCALLADRSRFFKDDGDGVGRWHTLIDYERFAECVESGKAFGPEDYVGKATPEWALWGNGGFDPRDERVDRKGRKIEA